MSTTIKAIAYCNKGYVREKNEDNLIFLDKTLPVSHDGEKESLYEKELDLEETEAIFGVFDGMGGYTNGEEASSLTAEIAKETYERILAGESFEPAMLKEICFQANKKICAIMEERHIKMGSTASMLYFQQEKLYLCNIGDSPIYQFHEKEFTPVYKEHTQRAYFRNIENSPEYEMEKFPLTQCLGVPESEFRISPYLKELEYQKGDIYLICSDGLSDMLRKSEIAQLLDVDDTLEDIGQSLLDKALEYGGKDNITIILLQVME